MIIQFQKKLFLSQKIFRFFLIFVFLFNYFNLFAQESDSKEEITTIKIINARETEYQKDEETENDIIILEGNVELTVTKGSSISEIKAEHVKYDRKTQMLYASDEVEIVTKSDSSGGETIKASSLIMNTSTLEGVFDNGNVIQTQSDAINLPSGSTLVVFSDLFGKNENTIVFKNSSLTFCDDPNPHWHIDATRTWLLPGGEFAFFNAVLYVGPVPVMYFPAFYYPKDELIFNPVFGYRNREGYYIQTTTYLFGRKPLGTESTENSNSTETNAQSESIEGLYNFMKPSTLKEQEREGLVLHNLDKDYTGDTSKYIKFMGDAYSNLGFFLGLEGNKIPEKFKYISNMNYNFSVAFSKTIFNSMNYYLPISSAGLQYLDESSLFGKDVPFRYKINFNVSFSKPFQIDISIPYYSDPFFAYDFERRSESMNWLSYLMSGKDNKIPEFTETSSLVWKISASNTFPIPSALNSYISSCSFTFSSSLNLSSATNLNIGDKPRAQNHDSWRFYTPERKFYYPSSITPINFGFNISGVIYQYPKKTSVQNTESYEIALIKPDSLLTQEEIEEREKNKESQNNQLENKVGVEEKQESESEAENNIELTYPKLQQQYVQTNIPDNFIYSLEYSFTPSFLNQITYDSSNFENQNELNWSKIKSYMYTLKTPLELRSRLNYGNNFLTLNNTIQYLPLWQDHTNTKGYSESEAKSIKVADYTAQAQTISNVNSISFKPFINFANFADTSLTWNTSFKLLRKKFVGDADNPLWKYYGLDFSDDESVTENLLNLTFASKQDNGRFSQQLILSSSLPPQVPKITGQLSLIFPYVNFSVSSGLQQRSKEDKTWIKNPLDQSLNISLLDSKLNISQSSYFNLEESNLENLKFSVSYNGFSCVYVMANTYDYDFDEDSLSGWISREEKSFIPYSLSMSYNYYPSTFYAWFNRISVAPTLSTSLVADLVRPTNSYFLFTPGITFKINNCLNISFSATSKNSVLYRYFQSMLGHPGRIPGEDNVFLDLLDSFRFDNEELRKNSGFKLKSLNFTITHNLHDWDFNLALKFEPRLITNNGTQYYDYKPYFTIGVSWNPMPSMKAKITDEYGELKFE